MQSEFRFDWVNDERCEITLDGEFVMVMDHGAHGWDGMRGIKEAVENIAGLLEIRISVVGEEGI